jgi:uncharacterized protein
MEANPKLDRKWSSWFEIPVTDMERARQFYESIFETKIDVMDLGGLQMGIFPHKEVGCALCRHEAYQPSDKGVLVYLDASPDLTVVLNRLEKAGGRILRSKTQISPQHGYMALFIDTEGNRLALHSDK